MGGSGLDRIDDFQKFYETRLDRIQFLRIKIGLGLNNITVRSSLLRTKDLGCKQDLDLKAVCFRIWIGYGI